MCPYPVSRKASIWSSLLWVVILSLFLSACEREPVRIGFVGEISGRVADLGGGARNGAILAVEDRNASGGVNGRPVELIIRDDGHNPDTAAKVIRELVSMKVEAVIGPMTSGMALAVVPILNESRVVAVSPTVTTTQLTGLDDHFLRVLPDTRRYAPKSAIFHIERTGRRRAALVYETGNSSYTVNWMDGFRNAFERRGGRIVSVSSFRSGGNVAFSPLVRDILSRRPDLVVLVCGGVDAALLCQQIRRLNRKITISVSEWGSTERFIELGGEDVEGVFFAQFLDHDNTTPRYIRFRKAYRARFGQDPGFPGVAGYDAATVVMDALAGRNKGESLKDAIPAMGVFQGLQRKIVLDRFGDTAGSTYITVVKNRRFVTLE